MVNFRFHVVSLIAIFLALAVGVVVGAGVIDRGVVDTLNGRLDRVEAKSDRIQSENNELTARNRQLEGVVSDLQPFAVSTRLAGDRVAVVAVRGIDGDRVKAVVTAAQQADATAVGTLWLEGKWALSSDGDVKALQSALGVTIKNKAALRAEGWRQLATRLAGASATAAPNTTTTDLLTTLQQAKFVGFDAVGNTTLAEFPGPGAGVVLAVGNAGGVTPDQVVLSLSTALHAADVPVVVAGAWKDVADGPAREDAVQAIRDNDLARTVSTVDDLDQPEGPTTVVLALADLLATPPRAGHYGHGPNTQPLPDPVTG